MKVQLEINLTDSEFLSEESEQTVWTLERAGLLDVLEEQINDVLGECPTPYDVNEFLEEHRDQIAGLCDVPSWGFISELACHNSMHVFGRG